MQYPGLTLTTALVGCQCSEDSENEPGDEAPTAVVSTTTGASTPPTATSSITNGNADILFLTPEQYSNQIYASFAYRYGWTDSSGDFFDAITNFYQVPLGGVDYDGTSLRDKNPKVQTMLTLRAVNWEVAAAIVWREANPDAPVDPIIFTLANPSEDRPYYAAGDDNQSAAVQEQRRESEARWQAQVEDIYWRMFNRPPSAEEIAMAKTHFNDSYSNGNYLVQIWMGYIYALMSTSEWLNS